MNETRDDSKPAGEQLRAQELEELAELLNQDAPELADLPFSLEAEPARRRGVQKGLFDR